MGGHEADPLGDVRPGSRPSWWLREALVADPGLPVAPLGGDTTADVAIVGGGYTGMWTAYFITEHDPGRGSCSWSRPSAGADRAVGTVAS